MRFHVCSLPHTQTTAAYNVCAYTSKVRGFCRMMKDRGHEVFLYAGEQNEAPCDELITCISEEERVSVVGGGPYVNASFDYSLPHWQKFNAKAAAEIRKRAHKTDFVCLIGGLAQKQIADALPDLISVEFGVGYGGVFSRFRVFESHAWYHTVMGSQRPFDPCGIDGTWFDEVIPPYLDPAAFPFSAEKDDYFLFVGRLIERKGINIAIDACKALGKNLVVAGPGKPPADCQYVGVVGEEERGRLMSRARALFVPTLYLEPGGNVAIEAMACGTPVIASPFGVFTETVIDGVTGFRCRTLREFVRAGFSAGELDPATIRKHVVDNYSLAVIGEKYERYFERLLTLWGDGWYATAA